VADSILSIAQRADQLEQGALTVQLPVTIDPRYHDAVLFDLDGVVTGGFCNPLVDGVLVLDSMVDLVGRLHDAGIATAAYSSGRDWEQAPVAARIDDLFPVRVDGVASDGLGSSGKPEPALLLEAARRLDVPPERSVVIEDSDAGAEAGRDGGFGLVIVVDGTRHADEVARCDADAVVADLRDVTVRTGDKRMSEIPNALESYGQLVGIIGARKPVAFFDFDGTLSEIASDPDTATLVDGAAEALEHLAADWPVVVLSGRDLVDVQSRVGIPGIWYAGSDGLELTAPDGSYHHNDEAAATVPTLERAAGALSDGLAQTPGGALGAQALRGRRPLP